MVLVTGATGLLGSYLVKYLINKGGQVRAIKRATSSLELLGPYAAKVQWVEGDITDMPSLEEAMQGIEKVYHCAAVISFLPSEVDYMMKVNIKGTENVMNAALYAGVKKVLHVSSIAAFGQAPDDKVIDEKFSDPRIGKSFWYYRSKHYSEREAWRAHAEGLDVTVVCPGTILGAGWWDDEPNSLFRDIYAGLNFYTTSRNSFVDVRDVVTCMYQLMEGHYSGEKFIVTAENLTFKEVMWNIADSLKVKRPAIAAGKLLRSIAWRLEAVKALFTKRRPLVTRESARLAACNFTYSNQKVKSTLNFNFRPVKQTINDTAQVFLESHRQGKDWGVFSEY